MLGTFRAYPWVLRQGAWDHTPVALTLPICDPGFTCPSWDRTGRLPSPLGVIPHKVCSECPEHEEGGRVPDSAPAPSAAGMGVTARDPDSGPAAHSAPRPPKEVAQRSHAVLPHQGLPTLGIPKPPKPLMLGENTCLSSDGVGGGGVSNLLPRTGPSQDMCWGQGGWRADGASLTLTPGSRPGVSDLHCEGSQVKLLAAQAAAGCRGGGGGQHRPTTVPPPPLAELWALVPALARAERGTCMLTLDGCHLDFPSEDPGDPQRVGFPANRGRRAWRMLSSGSQQGEDQKKEKKGGPGCALPLTQHLTLQRTSGACLELTPGSLLPCPCMGLGVRVTGQHSAARA